MVEIRRQRDISRTTMTINTNRLILALAVTVLSYTTSMVANDVSLVSELIEIYKGEQELLEQKKQVFIEYFANSLAEEGFSIEDLEDRYKNWDSIYKAFYPYAYQLEESHYLSKAHQIYFPLLLCKEYLELLKYPIQEHNIETLKAHFNETHHTVYSTKAVYAKDILTAVYFDQQEQDEKFLKQAKEASTLETGTKTRTNIAVSAYLRAKMYYKRIDQDECNVHIWATHLREAKNACRPETDVSEVFLTKLENEFTKLHEYYLENSKKIDASGKTVHKVLERFGYFR